MNTNTTTNPINQTNTTTNPTNTNTNTNIILENTIDEQIIIVDDNDNELFAGTRKEMRTKNLNHRSTSIFIYNPISKLFAIQKRAMKKEYFPGYFDVVTGGVVGYKERKEVDKAAERELYEEMGVKLEEKLKFIGKNYHADEYSKGFSYVYFFEYNFDHEKVSNSFTLNDGEVDEVVFWSIEDIRSKILDLKNVKITPDAVSVWTFIEKEYLSNII